MESIKSVAETTFDEALAFFRNFLDENGETAPILWTFKDNVHSEETDRFSNEFWLKLPLANDNEHYARLAYKMAQDKGFGLDSQRVPGVLRDYVAQLLCLKTMKTLSTR